MFEVFVLLSDLCNFSCSHCLNSSGPYAKKYRIQDSDLTELVAFVNKNNNVKVLHFSGGEPSLHQESIKKIQGSVRQDIQFSITTNGWFGERSKEFFDQIKLHEVVVSYDKFHQPFVKKETIKKLITESLSRGHRVILNWVFDSISDLAEAADLRVPGVAFRPTKMITSGRQKVQGNAEQLEDLRVMEGTCPSLDGTPNATEKIIFIPGKGLTPCCGPLAFNDGCSDSFLYSGTKSYSNNPIRKNLRTGTFREQFYSAGLRFGHMQFVGRCQACSFFYAAQPEIGLPSNFEILNRSTEKEFVYPFVSSIPGDVATGLSGSFRINYIMSGESPKGLTEPTLPNTLTVRNWSDGDEKLQWNFHKNVYMDKFPQFFEGEEEYQRLGLNAYIKKAEFKILYFKDGAHVGSLLANVVDHHPLFAQSTFHLGFLGYDSKALSLEEARAIKLHWAYQISKWNQGNALLTSWVAWFNSSSIEFHAGWKMFPGFVRFESKNAK